MPRRRHLQRFFGSVKLRLPPNNWYEKSRLSFSESLGIVINLSAKYAKKFSKRCDRYLKNLSSYRLFLGVLSHSRIFGEDFVLLGELGLDCVAQTLSRRRPSTRE